MNGAVVLFLDKVEKVNIVVENGIVLNGSLIKVFPLVNPARKVLLSNVPPFISDEALKRKLSRNGQLVSAIKSDSDLSVDKEDLGSGVKSSEKRSQKKMRRWILFLMM